MTSYIDFQKVKAAVPIRRVLEHCGLLEGLRERGDKLCGACPLCESKTAMRISQEKNCFMCFSCKTGGNMLDLVACLEGCTVREAAALVCQWFDLADPRPARKAARRQGPKPKPRQEVGPAPMAVPEQPAVPETPEGFPDPAPLTFELKLDPDHEWFAGSGLSAGTVREFGLGYCSRGMMGGRIAFPLRDAQGRLIGYAGRWPGDDPPDGQPLWKYPPSLPLERVVYPIEKLVGLDAGQLLVADDPLGVVRAWQLGLVGAFCIPSGDLSDRVLAAIRKAVG